MKYRVLLPFLSSADYKNEPIVKFEPIFAKKVNPFSIKSEPILQNEPIRILYPFRSPFTKPLENQVFSRGYCFFGLGEHMKFNATVEGSYYYPKVS